MKYNSEYQIYQKVLSRLLKRKLPYIIDVNVNQESFEESLDLIERDLHYTFKIKPLLEIDLTYNAAQSMKHELNLTPTMQDITIKLYDSLFKGMVIPSFNLKAV